MMRWIVICLVLTILAAAAPGCSEPDYSGKCVIEKLEGKVVKVNLNFPSRTNSEIAEFEVTDRKTMDRLIENVESLLLDMKEARDQMAVIEPPLEE